MTVQDPHRNDGSQSADREISSEGGTVRKPAFMYVHYLEERHELAYPVYLFQLDDTESIGAQIKTAVTLIRDGKVPEIKPGSSRYVEWRVYSYAVFVLDDEHGHITGVSFDHNRTFDHCDTVLADDGSWSSVYYLNKRKNHLGHDLGSTETDIIDWRTAHHLKDAASPGKMRDHQGTNPNTGP
jgi:hypothetical protein